MWTYEGVSLPELSENNILSVKVINNDIIIVTQDIQIKLIDTLTRLTTIIYNPPMLTDGNRLAHIFYRHSKDYNIYELPNGKLLCGHIIFDYEKSETFYREGHNRTHTVLRFRWTYDFYVH